LNVFLLQELEKGRYSTTDVYVYHMAIAPGTRDTLMLTDKRVMYIVHNDIFGGWQVLDISYCCLQPGQLTSEGMGAKCGAQKLVLIFLVVLEDLFVLRL
jgi:hypothetical protein